MTTSISPSADRIANVSLNQFKKLPKTGRPTTKEWTVFSSILQYDSHKDTLEVVACGTGTKCLGKDYGLSSSGEIINDSHAEVMTRRGFLRYVMESIKKRNHFSFDVTINKFRLDSNITFHFFTTHPPCGDASIFSIADDPDEPKSKKPKLIVDDDDIGGKISSLTHATGGKLIETEVTDLMSQDVGEIRTKPGKGVRTLSVSCSDKLSRWNILGLQGALLDCILESPVYLKSFTICGVSSLTSIERAIWKRWKSSIPFDFSERFSIQEPLVQAANEAVQFEYSKKISCAPSPNSIVWCNTEKRNFEVAVGGKRQGVTRRKINTVAGRLLISKIELLRQFLDIILNDPSNIKSTIGIDCSVTYTEAKNVGKDYKEAWCRLKGDVFGKWTTKTNIFYNFKLSDNVRDAKQINEETS